MQTTITKEQIDAISKGLTDSGKLIEAGWVGLKMAVMPPNAPQVQIDEMRKAFFAGAQHLFTSIIGILEPDDEPTEKDLERMTLIHKELEAFYEDFKQQHFL